MLPTDVYLRDALLNKTNQKGETLRTTTLRKRFDAGYTTDDARATENDRTRTMRTWCELFKTGRQRPGQREKEHKFRRRSVA